MDKEINKFINKIKNFARDVYKELGSGWEESIYQNALEILLRENNIEYDSQRVIPVFFRNKIVGEVYADLIIWYRLKNKKIFIIIDLKSEDDIKEKDQFQIQRYIKSLKSQVKENEEVYKKGFIFNFSKKFKGKIKDKIENLDDFKILEVEA